MLQVVQISKKKKKKLLLNINNHITNIIVIIYYNHYSLDDSDLNEFTSEKLKKNWEKDFQKKNILLEPEYDVIYYIHIYI